VVEEAKEAEEATDAAPREKADPAVHYAYCGLAMLLYTVLAAWATYHVGKLNGLMAHRRVEIPSLSAPLFGLVEKLGAGIFAPLALFVIGELLANRNPKLTRVYLAATLFLIAAGIYVAVALYVPARAMMTR
jgi:hypothetical protein